MQTSTTMARWLMAAVFVLGVAGSAQAQRLVTLRLNMATIGDTTLAVDMIDGKPAIEVRGAVDPAGGTNYQAPFTFTNGGAVIGWGPESTIEPTNIGGDYWEVSFQVDNEAMTQFKFYSEQAELAGLNGWEADPNPTLPPGTTDTTLAVHFFEAQSEWMGQTQDRGDYDWRPYRVPGGDSVAVWFRVFMNTAEGVNDGYTRTLSDEVKVAGADLGGMSQLQWNGNSGVTLMRESTDRSKPGYDLFSGVGYYPAAAAGQTQPYKFITVDGTSVSGWEEGNLSGDRTFVVPSQDTTLHWVFYGNSPAVTEESVTSTVIFSVDMTPLETIGFFDRVAGDSLQVRGSFNGWDCPSDDLDSCWLDRIPGELIYENLIPVTGFEPPNTQEYKYFINFDITSAQARFGVDVIPSGWEEPYSTSGANRKFTWEGNPDVDQIIENLFNDIYPYNILADGESVDVTFRVDMSPALSAADPFVPGVDSVIVAFEEPFFSMTQGFPLTPRGTEGDDRFLGDALNKIQYAKNHFVLTDGDADMVYEGTITVSGPSYAAMQYKYSFGGTPGFVDELGGSTSDIGRRRQRFVVRNPDGSWPAAFTVVNDRASGDTGPELWNVEGPLPIDANPATSTAIETLDGELPAQVTLGENYPNPFNPSTTFEYSIDRTMNVSVRVYDVLGRVVATLVDGVQPAATYRVTFDADRLASGSYIYRLETPSKVITRQMILVK